MAYGWVCQGKQEREEREEEKMSKMRHLMTGSGCDVCKSEGNNSPQATRKCKVCMAYLCYDHGVEHEKEKCT